MKPIVKIRLDSGARIPEYQSSGAAGADIFARLDATVTIPPGGRVALPTGMYIALPEGWEAQVRPRSGLALKHGVTCLNSPGTIDSDYRGEVRVILANLGQEAFSVDDGDRIAQLVFSPVARAVFSEEALDETERDSGGFGSTGRR